MRVGLTRIIQGLGERIDIPLEVGVPYATRAFSVERTPEAVTIAPIGEAPEAIRWPDSAFVPTNGKVRVNSEVLTAPRALVDDDIVEFGQSIYVVRTGEVARNEELEAAALYSDDHVAWRVLSDWLQEEGDPLGTRIAERFGAPDHLVEFFSQKRPADAEGMDFEVPDEFEGYFEVTTFESQAHHGLLKRLSVKSIGRWDLELVSAVLELRQARFLKELRLDCRQSPMEGLLRRDALDGFVEGVSQLPLPRSLEKIVLRVFFGHPPEDWVPISLPNAIRARCPDLRPDPLVVWARAATLQVVDVPPQIELIGVEPGVICDIDERTFINVRPTAVEIGRAPESLTGLPVLRFEKDGEDWFMVSEHANTSLARIGRIQVGRSRLVPGDRIVLKPGVVVRFDARE